VNRPEIFSSIPDRWAGRRLLAIAFIRHSGGNLTEVGLESGGQPSSFHRLGLGAKAILEFGIVYLGRPWRY
jgi:hypothetical protein